MELRLGFFHFGIKLGHGPYRVELELELNRNQVWFRLPMIGQGLWWRGQGWTVDGWSEAKNEGSAL